MHRDAIIQGIRLTAVALLPLLVACGNDVADSEEKPRSPADAGRVVVYSTFGEEFVQPVFDAYAAEAGVTVMLVTGDFAELAEKVLNPGAGPIADLFIAGNSGALWRAAELGIFRPTRSDAIDARVPERLRDPTRLWFAINTEARGIVFNADLVALDDLQSITGYASLGDERWRGRLCLSSSGHAANVSLLAMLVNDLGIRDTELLVRRWRANLAGAVTPDDGRLLQAVEAGECAVGIAGSSEFARYVDTHGHGGTVARWLPVSGELHVDASGAGVTRHAHNPERAAALLEWLTSDFANGLLAARVSRFPVNAASAADNSIAAWADFDVNPVGLASLYFLQEDAIRLAERAGYF
jgi:iron(III) transport system substrate-binding protein